MAAVDELHDVSGLLTDVAKERFAAAMWVWYYAHKNDTVKVHIWIIRTTIKIEQLYPLFVMLLGEDLALNHG
jgi:hypothetical protein